jgi:hypothetical protein
MIWLVVALVVVGLPLAALLFGAAFPGHSAGDRQVRATARAGQAKLRARYGHP